MAAATTIGIDFIAGAAVLLRGPLQCIPSLRSRQPRCRTTGVFTARRVLGQAGIVELTLALLAATWLFAHADRLPQIGRRPAPRFA